MRISDWSSDVCSSDLDNTGVDLAVGSGSIAVSLPDEAEAPSAIVRVVGEAGAGELVGTITDDEPVAAFAGLQAGTYVVEVSQAGFSTERSPVELADGESATVELDPTDGTYVVGQVTAGGVPAAFAEVLFVDTVTGVMHVGVSALEDGAYQINLPAGTYALLARVDSRSARLTAVAVRSEATQVEWTPPPGRS